MKRENSEGAFATTSKPICVSRSLTSDGYTLLLGFDGTLVINPHVYPKIPFDTLRDFAPITKIGDAALVLVAHPSVRAASFGDLVALSKATPGGLSYGTSGVGSTPHLTAELLKQRSGLESTHIPYKGGGQAMTDLIGGALPLLFTAVASAQQHIKSGKARGIAVFSPQRSSALPEVPRVFHPFHPLERGKFLGQLRSERAADDLVGLEGIDRLRQVLRQKLDPLAGQLLQRALVQVGVVRCDYRVRAKLFDQNNLIHNHAIIFTITEGKVVSRG